ncbi:Protein tincar [Lepeophtheirus salmonis]|uniref:Protein tincar n=1 Tax=Lepeophtheirus salmonis TaxID=72036 RepID=A0A7R8CNI8_LEPSM|nr:Protein tincar [Lepeophtheirus salmonis]CAF2872906.1 Protein tincar [Lepeophtheirus salmonis]
MPITSRTRSPILRMPGPSGSEGPRSVPGRATSVRKRCCDVHCNSLWSVWYGILVVIFQSFILYKCVTRFLIYVALPWPEKEQPYLELNLYVGLVGAGVVLLPFYFISFMFKIGNLANDGYKLGMELSSCAMDPPSILSRSNGVIRNVWHHGGPTSAFIHLVSAFCFVLPKIFIEGKLIHVGFLAKDLGSLRAKNMSMGMERKDLGCCIKCLLVAFKEANNVHGLVTCGE